ncbi:apiosidase-like domain-containing protein [Catalinimonas locisalis]|uniref:apiosidase-like domain-containing protein n=1 Tax=Catalinimonas locisalis TaxID=3133978 RepID=UPI0031017057
MTYISSIHFMQNAYYLFITIILFLQGCAFQSSENDHLPLLTVSENQRYLEHQDGTPFFWLGDTSWGMSEWLNKEDVDIYLDQRKAQGFNVLQICLFWGKREDDPVNFTTNPENAYGHQAFREIDGKPDPTQPKIVEGGSPDNPNDYWDHVDYIVQAAKDRNMILAVLPVWGRRYVNASHGKFSSAIFGLEDMRAYGKFLGERYRDENHLIWVMGGDVKADAQGDYLGHYRAMAEGILQGITQESVDWNQESPLWDYVLMTYHPDGAPYLNSSDWFHKDVWLDFNMIETFTNVNDVYAAVMEDYALSDPIKPTVMGEPGYEGFPIKDTDSVISAVQMRRQAYQSMFAGAAGFTYGGFRDALNNGPLFSPFKGWQKLMNMEGAVTLIKLKEFCDSYHWPDWKPTQGVMSQEEGAGELRKVAVNVGDRKELLVYFPDNSAASLNITHRFPSGSIIEKLWYNTVSGNYQDGGQINNIQEEIILQPPGSWTDAVLILREG